MLTPDNLNRVMLRHAGHLFSATVEPGRAADPVGRAVNLAGDRARQDRERGGLPAFHELCTRVRKLLDGRYFYSESTQYYCYTLAGSFTGFLIRRHGWERYRQFYRKTRPKGFESRFREFFGLSLIEAERSWHGEVLAMASLNQRLRDDRLFNEFE